MGSGNIRRCFPLGLLVALGAEPYALSVLALAGLVRIVTTPLVFARPSSPAEVFAFKRAITECSSRRLRSHPSQDLRESLLGRRSLGQPRSRCSTRGGCHRIPRQLGFHRLCLRTLQRSSVATSAGTSWDSLARRRSHPGLAAVQACRSAASASFRGSPRCVSTGYKGGTAGSPVVWPSLEVGADLHYSVPGPEGQETEGMSELGTSA